MGDKPEREQSEQEVRPPESRTRKAVKTAAKVAWIVPAVIAAIEVSKPAMGQGVPISQFRRPGFGG